jgi:hypothetical protein
MSSQESWSAAILSQLGPRATLAREEAWAQLWMPLGVQREELNHILDLFELEFGVSPGALRPTDSLAVFLTPVDDPSWFGKSVNQVRAGDRQLVLGAYLDGQCKKRGVPRPTDLTTVGDYVIACCGGVAT